MDLLGNDVIISPCAGEVTTNRLSWKISLEDPAKIADLL